MKKEHLKDMPEGLNLNTHTNAPTQIMGLHSPTGLFRQKSEKAGDSVPYPYLSALIDRKSFNRFNKRVVFDRSDYDDLLNQIVD